MGYLDKITGGRVSPRDVLSVNQLISGNIGAAGVAQALPTIGQISGADAAREAARQQELAGNQAISALRSDLDPYRQAGGQALPGLLQAISPEGQANFLQNNPLLSTLANDVQARLFANQAARGKLGSGETLTALQNALIPIGLQAQQQQFGQLFDVARMGQNAAAQTGTGTASLLGDIGSAQSAGTIGAGNLNRNLIGQLFGIGSLFAGGGTGGM